MAVKSSSSYGAMSSRKVDTGVGRNDVKYQVFAYLYDQDYVVWGLTIYELEKWCPAATLEYLKTRLHIWYRQGYLTRRKVRNERHGRKLYHYKLNWKGQTYVRYHIPKAQLQKAKAQIEQVRQNLFAELRAKWAKNKP